MSWSLLSYVTAFISWGVRFGGGGFALERVAVTSILICSVSLFFLVWMADSVAVMRSTTGILCSELAQLSPLAKTVFSCCQLHVRQIGFDFSSWNFS